MGEGLGLPGGRERARPTTLENGRCLVPAQWHEFKWKRYTLINAQSHVDFHQTNSFIIDIAIH